MNRLPKTEALELIEKLENHITAFTAWELDFIGSVKTQLTVEKRDSLSEKQTTIILELKNKAKESGASAGEDWS
jgi:hypothetical protein